MAGKMNELSIGDVAKATGLSVYTLRQWERRYGYPEAIRRDSGHRRYEEREMARLKLVAQALNLGYRAHKVVPLPQEELIKILQNHQGEKSDPLVMDHWLKLVKKMDEQGIIDVFHKDWATFGPVGFVEQRVGPFLERLGLSWRFQEISISQEHFFSELLVSFLTRKWREMNHRNNGETFLLTSLPGEDHTLGLHMCAVVLTAAGKRVVFLGSPTPMKDIVAATQAASVEAICLSFSQYFSEQKARKEVQKLRADISDRVEIVVGGDGAPDDIAGVMHIASLVSFYDWVQYEWKPKPKLWSSSTIASPA